MVAVQVLCVVAFLACLVAVSAPLAGAAAFAGLFAAIELRGRS
jgi:hypothetical protein